MQNKRLKNMILASLFLALGLVLPFLTGQIKQIGNMLLPMHIPVMLSGLICGPWYGLVVGLIVPVLRSAIFSMPIMYPSAIAMAFELATYGFVSGLLYSKSKWHCVISLLKSMVVAMIVGRVVWGIAMMCLLGLGAEGFTLKMFMAGAFYNAIPGIILQLVLIPVIMVALNRAKLVHFKKKG